MMYIRLSYDFTDDTPYPAGLWPVKINHVHDMAKGKVSNVYITTLCNHVGSHIDGPNHFGIDKKALNEFSLEDFIFDNPLVLDIPKNNGELIYDKDLKSHHEKIARSDLLLIRTGFAKIRSKDLKRYSEKSPGVSASAAQYIANEFPKLRAVGMDTLSFACPLELDEGIKAHQMLMEGCPRDIFLIEDINLDFDLSDLKQVLAIPIFFEKLDSAPCTVLGLVEK